jgi:hypothetical protein
MIPRIGHEENDMNPKVTNIYTSLDNINRTSARKVTITGTVTFPDWDGANDHIQGIAPLNGTTADMGCIAGSSSDGAYFATFQASRVQAVRIWPDRPQDYDHAGGVQLLGSILPLSVESDNEDDKAVVGFYDLSSLAAPTLRYRFDIPGRKASATAITNFTSGSTEKALLAVYEYDPRYMRFYIADYNLVGGTSNPWRETAYYTGNVFDGDQYQNFAMVTSTSNVIYLLGFREDEELHLFEVQSRNDPFQITGITRLRSYGGWEGSDWRYGVGAQIVNASQIRIFGTDKDPSGSERDYKFNIYVWS